jgi:hypothetical protein
MSVQEAVKGLGAFRKLREVALFERLGERVEE